MSLVLFSQYIENENETMMPFCTSVKRKAMVIPELRDTTDSKSEVIALLLLLRRDENHLTTSCARQSKCILVHLNFEPIVTTCLYLGHDRSFVCVIQLMTVDVRQTGPSPLSSVSRLSDAGSVTSIYTNAVYSIFYVFGLLCDRCTNFDTAVMRYIPC